MVLEFSRQIKKNSNIKFRGNPCSGTELFRANGHTDRHSGMTKLIVAFRNFYERAQHNTAGKVHGTERNCDQGVKWNEMAKKAVRLRTV